MNNESSDSRKTLSQGQEHDMQNCLCDEDCRAEMCALANHNCNQCKCHINSAKITESSFIAVSEDQLGISIDLVFVEDETLGWVDSQLIFLSEKIDKHIWDEAKTMGEALRRQLKILLPIRLDSIHFA